MRIILITFICTLSSLLFAQTQISGVVNSYRTVTQIQSATYSVNVSNASGIATGDLVLLIQMQGAEIDESLSDDFGKVLDFKDAGNHELHRVCQINGNTISMVDSIYTSFDVSQGVQLIRVPEYANGAQLSGDVNAQSWDGSQGGVVAIWVNGILDLNSFNIDASEAGFRGGDALMSGGGCLPLSLNVQYTDKNSANDRALKGEGIAHYIAGKECSRGPQSNGGGGGNNHNGGGSGGSHYGAGGAGGQRIKYSSFACGSVVGLETHSIKQLDGSKRLFLGGGGGAGHGNNAGFDGESGANGGGLIYIYADTVLGKGGMIANGGSVTKNSESEGAGGGGAGGTIYFVKPHTEIVDSLHLEVRGGDGGSVVNVGNQNCSGPGGGGGGGAIKLRVTSWPLTVTQDYNGGKAGITAIATQSSCPVGGSNGAKAGSDGYSTRLGSASTRIITPSHIYRSDTSCSAYTSPSGKYTWTTSGTYTDTAANPGGCNSVFHIDLHFTSIDTSVINNGVTLQANASGVSYQWIDCSTQQPIIGETSAIFAPAYSSSFAVVLSTGNCSDTSACHDMEGVGIQNISYAQAFKVYPNPSNNLFFIRNVHALENWSFQILSLDGRLIEEKNNLNSKEEQIQIESPGTYIISIQSNGQAIRQLLIKQ